MKTPFGFISRFILGPIITLLLVMIPAFSQTAFATSINAITISSAVIQNSTPSTVDIVISGANYNQFYDNHDTTADSTDLSHIHYNGNTPTSATMSGTTITATFPISVGTYKSGGPLTISANTLDRSSLAHNTSTLTLSDGSITDNAKPVVVVSDIDGDVLDASTSSPQVVQITFSEPVTIPTISVSPDGSTQTVTDCGDANAATWCFNYAIPSANTTETMTISDAQDLASSPNTMDSDSNHTFTVNPYEQMLDIVGDMINSGTSQIEIVVPSTGPILDHFTDSESTTADPIDLLGITYNGVNPTSATIDTENNALDLFFNISLSDPRNGINSWDITTAPNGDLDVAQQTVDTSSGIGNDDDYVPQDLITDDAAPVLVSGYAVNSGGSSPTTQVFLAMSENLVDVDNGTVSHPNFTIKNATTGQVINVMNADISNGGDNTLYLNLDTSDPDDYDGPLTFSYDTGAPGTQMFDGSNNYTASITDFPVTEANSGYAPQTIDSGSGTPSDPYRISSCAGIEAMNNHLSSSFLLTADASCAGEGNNIMVGADSTPFTGTFDGGGHTVTVSILGDSNADNFGLFRVTSSGAKLTNVKIAGSVQGGGSVGGLVGHTVGTTISYIANTATVTGDGRGYTGGIVGYTDSGSISNSYSNGTVSSGSNYTGGLVGAVNSTNITNSYAAGTVSGSDGVGGLVGRIINYIIFTNDFSATTPSGSAHVGALVGTNFGPTVYTNDYYDAHLASPITDCTGDGSDTSCISEDSDGSNLDYFMNNSNAPLASWDFTNIWQTTEGYPIFQSAIHVAPTKVLNLTHTGEDSGSVSLSWDIPMSNSDAITDYVIEYQPHNTNSWMTFSHSPSTATTATVTGLSSGTDYDFRVSAVNSIGTGPVSDLTEDATSSGGGGGGGATPISSCSDFENINNNLSGSYVLTTDLSCGGEGNAVMVGSYASPFTGTFDGQGHTITISVDDPIQFVGLFGATEGATITNLRLAGSVTGVGDEGALVGYADGNTHISFVGSTADVTDTSGGDTGGLVGQLIGGSSISNSYSQGTVSSTWSAVGGLVGYMNTGATVDRSYATGSVTGATTGSVGGLIGYNFESTDSVSNSFSAGAVTGSGDTVAGFFGYTNGATLTNDYFDGNRSRQAHCAGYSGDECTAVNTDGSSPSYFLDNSSSAPLDSWDFTNVWDIASDSYPILRSDAHGPTSITTCSALEAINTGGLAGTYSLGADLDCSGDGNTAMIGSSGTPFTGIFDGNGHTIKVVINQGSSEAGLFAETSGATIKNLMVTGSVQGTIGVGSLVGTATNTTFTKVAASAAVTSTAYNTGGLVGQLTGSTITDAYFTGTVTATTEGDQTGGIAGYITSTSTITNAYSTGVIKSVGNSIGGITGLINDVGSSIVNSFNAGYIYSTGGHEGADVGYNNGGTLTGDFYDSSISNTDGCDGFNNGGSDDCTSESDTSYFKNNNSVAPMSSWTFDGAHWKINENSYPTLFSYTAPPEISGISPSTGTTDGGDSVTISGVDFDENTVTVDGATASIVDSGSTGVIFTTPAHSAGTVPVTITNNDGQVATTLFTYGAGGGGGSPTQGDIKVTVTDLTGNPISGATVTAACPSWNNTFNTLGTTNGSGIVEVDPRIADTGCQGGWPISFRVSADGYITNELDWQNYNSSVDPENEIGGSTVNQFTLPLVPNFDGSGSGTSEDPYIISSCAQLEAISGNLDADYKIGTESGTTIDCTGINFQPIGSKSLGNAFTGILDGNGATVENVTINQPTEGEVGIFSYINSGATIKDLTLHTGTVTGEWDVGSLAGEIDRNATLQNISSDFTVFGNNDYDEGGIVGYADLSGGYSSIFSNLTYTGSMDINEGDIGGIIGYLEMYNTDTTLTLDHATVSGGAIGSTTSGISYDDGGLIGYLYEDTSSDGDPAGVTISNASVSSTVSTDGGDDAGGLIGYLVADSESGTSTISISNSTVTNTVTGQNALGGLIGQAQLNDSGGSMILDIDSSSVDHDVTGTGGDIGGLIGHAFVFNSDPILMRIKITSSFVSGNVTGDGSVGGLIGGTEGMGPGVLLNDSNSTGGLILQNDHTTGNVTGNVNDDSAVGAGGLVGYLWCSSNNSADPYGCSIASSYATGNVSGYRFVGGLVGYDGDDVSIGDAYAHGNVTGNNEVGGLIGQVDPSDITSLVSRTYATGAISSVGGSGSDVGGLIGLIGKITGGSATVSDSFAQTNMDGVTVGGSVGFMIANPAGGTKTNLWYTPTGSADLGCTGIGSDPDYCHNADNSSFFQNSTSNGPLANWDFTSSPIWISHSADYPTLTGNVYIPPAPTVSITTPADSSTVTTWSPSVDWGNATTCDYSYGDSDATTPVNCNNTGSDIPVPSTTGSQTLNIRGSNAGGSSSLVSSSFTYNPDIASEIANTSAYWKFDETTQSAIVADSSINGNNGTVSGSPMPSSDHPNLLNITPDTESLSFSSDSNDDVDVPDASSVNMNGSFSIAFWMKPNAWNDDQSRGVISKFNPDTDRGFIVYDDGSDSCGDASCGPLLNFRAHGSGGTQDYLHSTASVDVGSWQHWAIVYNTATRTVKIYKNGELDTTYTGITIGDTTNTTDLVLGFSQPWNGHFDGNLDDFRLYQTALTPSDVAYLAATGESDTQAPTLIVPASGYTYGDTNPMTVSFELPQDMHTGTLHLVFTPSVGADIDMLLRDAESGRVNTFHFTPSDLSGVDEIISSNMGSIPDGTYTVTLSYQDANQDAPATATVTNVTIASAADMPVLTEVTPIASSTTADNATYQFSNTESSGDYEFSEITQSGDGTVTTHVDPLTHIVSFTGLQVGETYSTSFEFIDADHHVSNTLAIGPFTVIAPPSSGGGGGGGGSSGGSSSAGCIAGVTCPSNTVTVNTANTSTQGTPGGGAYHFPRQLKQNVKPGDDVTVLQKFLNTHGFPIAKSGPGSKGHETKTFGPATKAALMKFQKANKITPVNGILGPKTKAAIEKLMNK